MVGVVPASYGGSRTSAVYISYTWYSTMYVVYMWYLVLCVLRITGGKEAFFSPYACARIYTWLQDIENEVTNSRGKKGPFLNLKRLAYQTA